MLIILLFFTVGILYIGLGLPLYLEKISPNMFYGFRTQKTLSDKKIWFAANKVSGKDMIIAGIAISASAILIELLLETTDIAFLGIINTAILLVISIIMICHSLWSLKKLS